MQNYKNRFIGMAVSMTFVGAVAINQVLAPNIKSYKQQKSILEALNKLDINGQTNTINKQLSEGKINIQKLNEQIKKLQEEQAKQIEQNKPKNQTGSLEQTDSNVLYLISTICKNLGISISNYKYTGSTVELNMSSDMISYMVLFWYLENHTNMNVETIQMYAAGTDGKSVNTGGKLPKNYDWAPGEPQGINNKPGLLWYYGVVGNATSENTQTSEPASGENQVDKNTTETPTQKTKKTLVGIAKEYSINREEMENAVVFYSKVFNISPQLVMSIIENESSFDNAIINYNTNGTVDRGLMQVNEGTGPDIAKGLGISYIDGMEFNPYLGIQMGVYYLSYIQKNGNDDIDFMTSSYNMGLKGANIHKSINGTYESEYSKKIKEDLDKYEYMLNKELPNDYQIPTNAIQEFERKIVEVKKETEVSNEPKNQSEKSGLKDTIVCNIILSTQTPESGTFLLKDIVDIDIASANTNINPIKGSGLTETLSKNNTYESCKSIKAEIKKKLSNGQSIEQELGRVKYRILD